jgi:hypothetical protein
MYDHSTGTVPIMFLNTVYSCTSHYRRKRGGTVPRGDSSAPFPPIARIRRCVKRELGVSTVYNTLLGVLFNMMLRGKDPRICFSLHGLVRRFLRAERSGVPARLPGGWPKVPPERTISSVSGARCQLANLTPQRAEGTQLAPRWRLRPGRRAPTRFSRASVPAVSGPVLAGFGRFRRSARRTSTPSGVRRGPRAAALPRRGSPGPVGARVVYLFIYSYTSSIASC